MMKPAVYVYIYNIYILFRVQSAVPFGSPARMDVQKAEHL